MRRARAASDLNTAEFNLKNTQQKYDREIADLKQKIAEAKKREAAKKQGGAESSSMQSSLGGRVRGRGRGLRRAMVAPIGALGRPRRSTRTKSGPSASPRGCTSASSKACSKASAAARGRSARRRQSWRCSPRRPSCTWWSPWHSSRRSSCERGICTRGELEWCEKGEG